MGYTGQGQSQGYTIYSPYISNISSSRVNASQSSPWRLFVKKMTEFVKYESVLTIRETWHRGEFDKAYRLKIFGITTRFLHNENGPAYIAEDLCETDGYYLFGISMSKEKWENDCTELKLRKLKL